MVKRYDETHLSRVSDLPEKTMTRRSFVHRASVLGGAAVVGGTFVTLLSACGDADEEPSGTGASEDTPTDADDEDATETPSEGDIQRGGAMSWAYTQIPTRLDPVWTQARTDGTVLSNIVENLVEADEAADLKPALAEDWQVSQDGLIYTFHLRENVQFHNGEILTAEDVLASLERSRRLGVYTWTLEPVNSIEASDDLTVELTLDAPVASFLARIAVRSNAIFPAEEVDAIGDDEFDNPIGTGPFMVSEWVHNSHLTLEKNPNYWQIAPDGEPYPYLERLEITQVPEITTAILQVQSGQLDGIEGAPFSQVPSLEEDERGQLLIFPQQQIYFMVLQLTNPPFDDVKVRQAMSLALDRQVFVDRATAGLAEVANSFFPNSAACWSPSAELPYDPDRARQLIAESTYPEGHSGAKLQLPSGSQLGRDNAVLAKDMWDQIGIELTIEEVESSTLGGNWYESNFEAISGYQWTNGMADPEQHVQFFFNDPRMNTGYEPDQHALDLVEQASEELDPDARCEIYHELQDIYNEDVGGTISLYYTPSVNYVSPNMQGFTRSPLGVPYWWRTWLEE
jgi:peptide/nickel transport system substrate-binding protein